MTRTIKKVLLSSKQGGGKTTTARHLQEWCWKNRWLVQTIKFADPLYKMHDAVKEVAREYDIPMAQKDGNFLQWLGTEWGRKEFGEDVWVNACLNKVKNIVDFWNSGGPVTDLTPGLIIIDDCRFENEFTAFYDAIRVRLSASREVRRARTDAWRENDTHASEVSLDAYEADGRFDLILDTESLSVDEVVAQIVKKLEVKNG